MPDKTWKATERAIAHRLGGVRVGCTGHNTPDVATSRLAIEVKTRRELPAWLRDAMQQAHDNAGERVPVVILHQIGRRHDDDLVLLRFADFEHLAGQSGDSDRWANTPKP